MVLNERAKFDLAERLRREGAPLGDVFAFVSRLYFRGKLAYSRQFASPPDGIPGSLVITPGYGLVPVETPVTLDQLRQMAMVPIDVAEARYLEPLVRDAKLLVDAAGPECRFVLLGSIATAKYVDPLLAIFGERLVFPPAFVGAGI